MNSKALTNEPKKKKLPNYRYLYMRVNNRGGRKMTVMSALVLIITGRKKRKGKEKARERVGLDHHWKKVKKRKEKARERYIYTKRFQTTHSLC